MGVYYVDEYTCDLLGYRLRMNSNHLFSMGRLVVVVGLVSACAGAELKPSGPAVGGMAPTPFTADQIRIGCPDGREDVFETVSAGQTRQRWMRFENAGEQEVTVAGGIMDNTGQKTATQTSTTRWEDLRKHALYPASATTITQARVRVRAGTFEALRYVVTELKDGKRVEKQLWFAPSLPGPPVRYEIRESGSLVFSMQLISTSGTQ